MSLFNFSEKLENVIKQSLEKNFKPDENYKELTQITEEGTKKKGFIIRCANSACELYNNENPAYYILEEYMDCGVFRCGFHSIKIDGKIFCQPAYSPHALKNDMKYDDELIGCLKPLYIMQYIENKVTKYYVTLTDYNA